MTVFFQVLLGDFTRASAARTCSSASAIRARRLSTAVRAWSTDCSLTARSFQSCSHRRWSRSAVGEIHAEIGEGGRGGIPIGLRGEQTRPGIRVVEVASTWSA